MITVYGLTDEHGQIRYVGQTQNCKERFQIHRQTRWTHPFPIAGMAVLSRTMNNRTAGRDERRWIKFFGLQNLWNTHHGARLIKRSGRLDKLALRIPYGMFLQLKALAGPHGSVSSVVRMMLARIFAQMHTQTVRTITVGSLRRTRA